MRQYLQIYVVLPTKYEGYILLRKKDESEFLISQMYYYFEMMHRRINIRGKECEISCESFALYYIIARVRMRA